MRRQPDQTPSPSPETVKAGSRPNPAADTAALAAVIAKLGPDFYASIAEAAEVLTTAFAHGGKALICGNGGSAAEAQHFSDELLGRYRANRPGYPVIALTADSAALTCIGNDFGFTEIFARQVQAYGNHGDVLLTLSTSGNSPNILRAVEVAKERGLTVIALTGPRGTLRERADISIDAPSAVTARIQEIHLHAIHLLSEYFEPPRAH
ncbi:MAG: D-sedoheptulose 7-phosphate isomerase [Parcubacteria group bacterium Gr01-1014_38]|nr:MAG: D-sedoheptulose 7-phosphate isomerase [Parcubacteria group bacterium Gr01-1014_38]